MSHGRAGSPIRERRGQRTPSSPSRNRPYRHSLQKLHHTISGSLTPPEDALYNDFRSTPLQIADQEWKTRPQPRRVMLAIQCAFPALPGKG